MCESKVDKLLKNMGGVIERQDKMEEDIKTLRKEMDDMRQEKVKDKVTFADILKKDIAQELLDRDKGIVAAGKCRRAEGATG